MPFRSEKQRKYMWANHPDIAQRWSDTYGSTPTDKDHATMPVSKKTRAPRVSTKTKKTAMRGYGNVNAGVNAVYRSKDPAPNPAPGANRSRKLIKIGLERRMERKGKTLTKDEANRRTGRQMKAMGATQRRFRKRYPATAGKGDT